MKQLCADARTGAVQLLEVPAPSPVAGAIRVRTRVSVISSGTERAMLDLASKSLIGKALARPDLVKKVVERVRTAGVQQALQSVKSRLDQPVPLGYSASGVVESVGPGVQDFVPGDRVAIAGAGYANHAEANIVPVHLAARLDDAVSFEDGAYATLAAIALQGLRVGRPAIGETVVVVGLGLIGLLTVQLLGSAGCQVVGVDPNAERRRRVEEMGLAALEPDTSRVRGEIDAITGGQGADAVYLTASTDSELPVEQAGEWCRKKGVVVVVGDVRMDVPRRTYYAKELELRLSTSYGPGRYDPSYEEGGLDYPYPYVRWTEQRNLAAAVDLMRTGRLTPSGLTTHRFDIDQALDAFAVLEQGADDTLGIVLTYGRWEEPAPERSIRVVSAERPPSRTEALRIGFIGAGNYAGQFLLPILNSMDGTQLSAVATTSGLSAASAARRFGFATATTDVSTVLGDPETDAVFVTTRHDSHADLAASALRSGKHVFVEKPLALSPEQLDAVESAWNEANSGRFAGLMVGVNRRFAPLIRRLKGVLDGSGPLSILYAVNSGPLPEDAWFLMPGQGGGMLVSEASHFIDVMIFLVGSRPVRVTAEALVQGPGAESNFHATVRFADGSVGMLSYVTTGDAALGKERIRVAGRGVSADVDDFRKMTLAVGGRRRTYRSRGQDKGQAGMLQATVAGFRGIPDRLIPMAELSAGMRTIFAIREALRAGGPIDLA